MGIQDGSVPAGDGKRAALHKDVALPPAVAYGGNSVFGRGDIQPAAGNPETAVNQSGGVDGVERENPSLQEKIAAGYQRVSTFPRKIQRA